MLQYKQEEDTKIIPQVFNRILGDIQIVPARHLVRVFNQYWGEG